MVLEQIFSVRWLERKEHAFFLGLAYSLIGIFSAWLIFPNNVGIMSIAFTSILLIPSLNMLLRLEENAEIREDKFSIRLLLRDHKDVFKVYLFLFLGIFTAYCIITLLLSMADTQTAFYSQLNAAGISGYASFSGKLVDIIENNLLVFAVCFLLSLIYGAGSILFITWNASVWGVVFAYLFRFSGGEGLPGFMQSLLPFLPHMTTEALAYISAAIVGGVVSKAALREKLFSRRFKHILTDALLLLLLGFVLVIIAAFIEVKYFMKL